jgi:hypothetical protein
MAFKRDAILITKPVKIAGLSDIINLAMSKMIAQAKACKGV